jgi:hypothetical protein
MCTTENTHTYTQHLVQTSRLKNAHLAISRHILPQNLEHRIVLSNNIGS